jgi:hypothetical protein
MGGEKNKGCGGISPPDTVDAVCKSYAKAFSNKKALIKRA